MQNTFPSRRSTVFCIAGSLLVLQACSLGKPYSEIDPARAAQDVRTSNGYLALKSVPEGSSKLVLRSTGAPRPVEFSFCESIDSCEKRTNLGSVANSGQGVVYPWIARLNAKANGAGNLKPYLQQLAMPGRTIAVRGFGTWSGGMGPGQGFVTGKCGPVYSTLTPQEGRAYVIEFQWENDTCRQAVFDATNPDDPVLMTGVSGPRN